MIRYDFDRAAVEADIRDADPRWFEKARARTDKFAALGRFEDTSPIWSAVKPAFMRLQMNKCAFCERQFENPEYGRIEFDVEHFRPKSAVATWPDAHRHGHLKYPFSTGVSYASGYFWLAYELENYAASCKVCNSILKLSYFPIAGDRAAAGATRLDLAQEQPFLCYPIGGIDVDPSALVTFIATTAIPAAASGHERQRGQVIIDFFELNDREQLHRERARMIALFGPALHAEADGRATDEDKQIIVRMGAPALPHAGCVRAFARLWKEDKPTAARVYDHCRAFAVNDGGTAPPWL